MTDRTNETLRMSETLNAMMEAVVAELAITRAQLAQREAEIEALRGKVEKALSLLDEGHGGRDWRNCRCFNCKIWHALSDNRESPALTDKEA